MAEFSISIVRFASSMVPSEHMEIAVIIPLFNGSKWIRQTLTSATRQTRPAAEIVVVDDGSTDGGPEIVQEFPGVRLIPNASKGSNPARCFGVSQTSAPYLALLDQDDLWHPHHLRLMAGWLDAHEACRAIASIDRQFGKNQPDLKWNLTDGRAAKLDAWAEFPFGPRLGTPSAVLIRRTALEEIGGWPTEFPGVGDYFAWLGLSANGTSKGGMGTRLTCTTGRRRHAANYSMSLRTGERLIQYSEVLLYASRSAAERFGKDCSLPPDRLARRLGLAEVLHEAVVAFAREDWDAYAAAARQACFQLAEVSPNIRAKFGGMMCWLFDGRRLKTQALHFFDNAISRWPEEDTGTRAILNNRRNQYAAFTGE